MHKQQYEALPKFLLRIPAFPSKRVFPEGPFEEDQVSDVAAIPFLDRRSLQPLLRALDDPLFRTAIAVATPALFSEIARSPDPRKLDPRTALKLLKYLIRMSIRPTPYGLFAGVALASWGARTTTAQTTELTTSTRIDVGWLKTLLEAFFQQEANRELLTVAANPLIQRIGNRLYLQRTIDFAKGGAASDTSIRASGVVQFLLEKSGMAITWKELRNSVMTNFEASGGAVSKIDRLLQELLERGFLVTQVLPAVSSRRPEKDALRWIASAEKPSDLHKKLTQIILELDEWGRSDWRDRDVRYNQLTQRALDLTTNGGGTPFQTDVVFDVGSFYLTSQVAEEAASAAELLLQLSRAPSGPRYLEDYRMQFLAKYGENRLVPISEVLQEDVGIGTPNFDEARAQDRRSGTTAEREQVLASLIAEALMARSLQVNLSDESLARLKNTSTVAHWPESLELFLSISADLPEAIDRGEFRLVLSPTLGSLAAGRAFGRFAYALGSDVDHLLLAALRKDPAEKEKIQAELTYQPTEARLMNVLLRPIMTDYEICIASKPSVAEEFVLTLGDLLLGVEGGRFFLYSKKHSRQVHARSTHMLNASAAPSVVRFLSDVSQDGVTQLMSFDWGEARHAPFLPRIVRGRIVLSLAEWKLNLTRLNLSKSATPSEFREALAHWSETCYLPRYVYLSELDNRILLDTDNADHVEILRLELCSGAQKRETILLQEALPSHKDGWFTGIDGSYMAELVVPFVKRVKVKRGSAMISAGSSDLAAANHSHALESPGGDWLFLKLYCSRLAEEDLLCDTVAQCVRSVAADFPETQFFFIRYTDPERHLRLRWSGSRTRLWLQVFPLLCEWSKGLLKENVATRVTFDTYDPEVERYGGPEGLRLAEGIACVDSAVVMTVLDGIANGELYPGDRLIVAVATIEAVLSNLNASPQHRSALLADRLHKSAQGNILYRKYRESLSPVRDYIASHRISEGSWMNVLRGYEAFRSFGSQIQESARNGTLSVRLEDFYASIIHMHCNRLLGLNREAENDALLLWGRTCQAAGAMARRREGDEVMRV